MKLFDEKERTDSKPANHLDNTYDYYDRSNLGESKSKRDILNSWFKYYPETERKELKARFKKEFSSAFFELFIHELFRRQGFELEAHPSVQGTSKKPDFLITGKGIEFYLEAKEAKDKSEAEMAIDKRVNLFYDSLNKTKSPNFLFNIEELIIKTNKQPSGKKVAKFLESKLQNYNPDEVTEKLERLGLDAKEKISYEDDDLKLVISLIPKLPEFRDINENRPIGIYGSYSFWGGAENSIKSGIEKKAGRYGQLDKPYLICINATSDRGTHDFDVMNSLFGSLKISWSTNPQNRDEKWIRDLDGVFLTKQGPQFTRVSGIFITHVNSSNFHVANYWFVKHPFASKDLDMTKFDLAKIFVENKQIKKEKGKSIGEILEVKEK